MLSSLLLSDPSMSPEVALWLDTTSKGPDEKLLELMHTSPHLIDTSNKWGHTALHEVASRGSDDMVAQLLRKVPN